MTGISTQNNKKHYFILFLASLCFSGFAIFTKLLDTEGVSPFAQAFYRSLIAASIGFLVLLPKRHLLRLQKKEIKYLTVNALLTAANMVTFSLAIYFGTEVIKAMAIAFSYPIPIIIFSMIWLKEKPSKKHLLAVILSLISIMLLINVFEMKSLTEFKVGDIFAFLVCISFGMTIVWGRKIRLDIDMDSTKTTFFTFLFILPLLTIISVVMTALGIDFLKPDFSFPLEAKPLFYIFMFGSICAVLPTIFLNYSAKYVKSFIASIILLLELLWVTIFSVLFFNETVGIIEGLGMIGLLLSLLLI